MDLISQKIYCLYPCEISIESWRKAEEFVLIPMEYVSSCVIFQKRRWHCCRHSVGILWELVFPVLRFLTVRIIMLLFAKTVGVQNREIIIKKIVAMSASDKKA